MFSTARSAAVQALRGVRALSTTPRAAAAAQRVVLVDGCRIPFHMSGTVYKDLIAQDLQRMAIKGLVSRNALEPTDPDCVVTGNVIQEVRTSNIAREAALAAGISNKVPAHTVTLACISSNVAVSSAAGMIHAGQAKTVIAGGAETMSDVPIRFPKKARAWLMQLSRARSNSARLQLLKQFRPSFLAPEAPAIAEFSTGEVMGHSSDRLAARFGVTREEQDAFALRSHQNAAKAHAEGKIQHEIVPTFGETMDNGIKGDSTIEKLGSLKPAFIKPHGTHTAANSSFLTDGASAALIMSEDHAVASGFAPKAVIKDWIYVAQDPKDELLLGPAYAVPQLLARHGLKKEDIDVWELHEAFAGQVLANLRAMESEKFCKESIGVAEALGEVPMDKLNLLGGSLSIGHPFAATGVRIITTAATRLEQEDGQLAVLAACAAGGNAVAMLIERWHPKVEKSSK